MPDKTYRALLTDREIEILTGAADVSNSYRYRVVTRVREKIERIGEVDLRVLDDHHDTLGDELRDVVCKASRASAPTSDEIAVEYHDGVQNRSMTFEAPEIRAFTERYLTGRALNICAGETQLTHPDGDEVVRNDTNEDITADTHRDALALAADLESESFGTIVLDPPWTIRKGNEKYDGETVGKLSTLRDRLTEAVTPGGYIIQFGRMSSNMGEKRGYEKVAVGVFCHGGDFNDTIGLVERRRKPGENGERA
jgi:hypothetical protein